MLAQNTVQAWMRAEDLPVTWAGATFENNLGVATCFTQSTAHRVALISHSSDPSHLQFCEPPILQTCKI